MTKPLVTVFILAYNARDYIRETIESILNQDETSFELVIRDNGSTDNTYQIIQEYALKDKRIRIIRNKENHHNDDGTYLTLDQYCPDPQGEYFTYMDSDDLLKKDYISTLYQAAKCVDADIAIAGTTMFEDESKQILGNKIPPGFVFHAGEKLGSKNFVALYGSLRPFWGKLYRTEFFLKYAREAWNAIEGIHAGGDTIFSLLFVSKANCIVSIARSLHMYRIKKQGHYNSSFPDIQRIYDGERLFFWATKVLPYLGIEYNGVFEFLYRVYFAHLQDLLVMCHNSTKMSLDNKYAFYEQILTSSLLATANTNSLLKKEENELIKFLWSVVLKKDFKYDRSIGGFLQKIVLFIVNPKEVPQSIKNLYLLLGVFSEKNTYYFGKEFLGRTRLSNSEWIDLFFKEDAVIQRAFVNCPIVFRNFIASNITTDTGFLKLKMLEQYDAGNMTDVMDCVIEILSINPIDIEGIYFGIIMAYQLGNEKLLEILLNLSDLFWEDNEELCELKKQIYNK